MCKEYICNKCKGKHWHPFNAYECCEDLTEEQIKNKIRRDTDLFPKTNCFD